jgi:hypothetical protein
MRVPISDTPRLIYEINTRVWLSDLSRQYGANIDLNSVPPTEWDTIAQYGFHAVWLMGVWERSPAGIAISNQNVALLNEFRRTLADFEIEDNAGSPYCVLQYVVDPQFGGPAALASARGELARRGVKLLLDFVPNHVAPDNPWVTDHPEYFFRRGDHTLPEDSECYTTARGDSFACGRDPNFPPWSDVVQLNGLHAGVRIAMLDTLLAIASQCDGVRCDMAVLLIHEVFAATWNVPADQIPKTEYWMDLIQQVKVAYPSFIFIAEAYWGRERELQGQGFDLCYDKLLYDHLRDGNISAIGSHFSTDVAYQRKLVRFTENHDELRSSSALPPAKLEAGAVIAATLPGAVLFHEGQLEGRRTRVPVFLRRRPEEAVDLGRRTFYKALLVAVCHPVFSRGDWTFCRTDGWPDNQSAENLAAWLWDDGMERRLIVVNLSERYAQGQVRLPWQDPTDTQYHFVDPIAGVDLVRNAETIMGPGLYVELAAWKFHFFEVHRLYREASGHGDLHLHDGVRTIR